MISFAIPNANMILFSIEHAGMVRSVNICGNKTMEAGIVSLHSPEYPNQYPTSMDCRCEIEAEKESSLMVNFQVKFQ